MALLPPGSIVRRLKLWLLVPAFVLSATPGVLPMAPDQTLRPRRSRCPRG